MRRLVAVLSLLIAFLWNLPVALAQFSEAGVEKFRVAVDAPDSKLKEVGGSEVSLKEFRGKIVLLNFFAPW